MKSREKTVCCDLPADRICSLRRLISCDWTTKNAKVKGERGAFGRWRLEVGGESAKDEGRRTMDEGRGTREDRDLTSFFSSSPGRIQVGAVRFKHLD